MSCQEVMVQDLWDKARAEGAVWAEVVGKAEVEWVACLPRDRVVFVCAPTVATKKGME